jgi:polyisoprenoid-binding protein YceI
VIMVLTTGEYNLDPQSGRVLIKTGRSGLGRRVGHDLTIEVTRWSATATVDLGEPVNSAVTAEIEVDSFEVREGVGGVKALTDSDRADILKNIREKVLQTATHPKITFRSTSVAGTPESFMVEGDLTIKGVTQPVTVRAQVSGDRLTGSATVVQTRWGIKPFSALLGQLKVADAVEIEFDVEIPSEAA